MVEDSDPYLVCMTRRCSNNRKRQIKLVPYRVIGFLCIIGATAVMNNGKITGEIIMKRDRDIRSDKGARKVYVMGDMKSNVNSARRIDLKENGFDCQSEKRVQNKLFLLLYGAGVLYMFFAIAIVCDEFFVPALEEIASEQYFNLSMDVAGATLMAAGGSAPELFTSLIGTFQGSEVGFGTIVGSAVFNVLFVIGMCAIFSKDVLTLTWWPLARDCLYYVIGLSMLTIFCGYISPGKIEIWEALVLFALYIVYVTFMKYNSSIWSIINRKLSDNGKVIDENNKIKKDYTLGSGKVHTFRAGLLNLFMGKGSLLDQVGIAMVTKISGDVETVFKSLDVSGDGFIDYTEFRELVDSLGATVSDDEITQAISDLDDNRDGKVNTKM